MSDRLFYRVDETEGVVYRIPPAIARRRMTPENLFPGSGWYSQKLAAGFIKDGYLIKDVVGVRVDNRGDKDSVYIWTLRNGECVTCPPTVTNYPDYSVRQIGRTWYAKIEGEPIEFLAETQQDLKEMLLAYFKIRGEA